MPTMETSAQAKARLNDIIARAHKPETVAALKACLSKPTKAKWEAAEKAAWGDVPLTTNDCLWLRAKAGELTS